MRVLLRPSPVDLTALGPGAGGRIAGAWPTRGSWPLVAWALLAGFAAAAEEGGVPAKPAPGSARAKLPSAILALTDAPQAAPERLAQTRSVMSRALPAGEVAVRLDAAVDAGLEARIAASGATVVESAPRWSSLIVRGTPAQIAALADEPAVRGVHLARAPRTRTQGVADNHADIDLRVAALRSAYGATGASRKVGVISDSIHLTPAVGAGSVSGSYPNALLGGTTPQGTADLPASVQLIRADSGSDATDEGEAMLEVVHDLAPGSPLAFCPVGDSQTSFASAYTALRAAGCAIMVDDIGFPDEPFFQDGPVAQAIDAIRAGGGLVFSAAGNQADYGIVGTFHDVDPAHADPHGSLPDGSDFHDWGLGGAAPAFLPIDVPLNGFFEATLEWNQPFASFGLGSGAQSDLDLFLYAGASTSSSILTYSADGQGTTGSPSGDPVEVLSYRYTSSSPSPPATKRVYLALGYYRGVAANAFRLVFYSNFAIAHTGAMSMYGHAAAAGAIAVAAVDYLDIATPSADATDPAHTNVEYFSSRGGAGAGGIPFYFDIHGNALAGAPQRRAKPDLSAPDGVNVSVFSEAHDRSQDADTFPNFFGTSCAAPNAAAAAAVVWDASPRLSADQVAARLAGSAVDLVASAPPSAAGFDDRSGWGLVDARAAVQARPGSVSSATADGVYTHGTIALRVTYLDPITVDVSGGVPTLLLATAPTPRSATWTGLSGGNTLTFAYVIQDGDEASDLDCAGVNALALDGALIADAHGPADTTLPAPGSSGSLAAHAALVIDARAPSLAIAPTPASTRTGSIVFAFHFSHAVSGFTAGDVQLSDGVGGAFAGSGADYTLQVGATAPGTVGATVPAGAASDVDGRANSAASASATYDVSDPTLSIAPSRARVATRSSFTVALQFSEPVSGFSAARLSVVGGSVAGLSGSGAAYVLTVLTGDPGTLSIAVDPSGISDLAGNPLGATAPAEVTVVASPKHGGCGSGGGFAGIGLAALLVGRAWRARRAVAG